MSMHLPTQCVSVVVPALNNAETIKETLLSCLAEPEVAEVIVVLAPSEDESGSIVESIRSSQIRIIEVKEKGIALQMNAGILYARCEFCCKIDADDTVISGRFSKQVRFLRDHDDYAAIAGGLASQDMLGRILSDSTIRFEQGDVTDLYLSGTEVAHLGTLLIRTEKLREIGGFREWFLMSEDYDTSFRLAEVGKIWLSEIPSYCFRIRPNSITHSYPLALSSFYSECARKFAKQRAKSGVDDLGMGRPPSVPPKGESGNSQPFDPRLRASNFLVTGAWDAFQKGERRKALSRMLEAVKRSPRGARLMRLRELAVITVKAAFSWLRSRS